MSASVKSAHFISTISRDFKQFKGWNKFKILELKKVHAKHPHPAPNVLNLLGAVISWK